MKKLTATALFLSVLLFFGTSFSAEQLTITFQRSAVVEDNDIRLGDIVTFSENDETTKALASLVVGDAPEPGERLLLRSVKVRNMLLRFNNIPRGTYWRGSGTVSVLREGVTIDSDMTLGYINDYIESHKSYLPAAHIKFIPKVLPEPFSVPVGNLSCEVIPSHPDILRSQRFSLIFRIGNRVVRNTSVFGQMKATADVVVSTKSLNRGDELSETDLRMSEMDIAQLPDVSTDLQSLIGKRLRTSIRPNQPIQEQMVEALPVVTKDDPVTISLRSGTMLVTARGYAVTDGAIDQIIKVRNSSSNKILRARVTAPGSVEIEL